MSSKNEIKCCVCGQFIGYQEFENGFAFTKVIPDSHFGPEQIIHCHESCVKIGELQSDTQKQG